MQIEFLVNGGVSLLIAPDNEMEEALLKQMMKQRNDITEIRTTVHVLNKSFRNGILIGKKTLGIMPEDGTSNELDFLNDADKKETM
jgi:hypothetical protein